MGRFVECVTPRNLRAHVSQGAAIHSLYLHGLGHDVVRPITSEPIYVLTRDDNQETVVDAGSPVPSSITITQETVIEAGSPVPSPTTITSVTVGRDLQARVELPFCVGGRDKILAVLTVPPPSPPGWFEKGETIRISSHISRDKLLVVKVHAGGRRRRLGDPESAGERRAVAPRAASARGETGAERLDSRREGSARADCGADIRACRPGSGPMAGGR